jgi:large subunit ribosomal protein L15
MPLLIRQPKLHGFERPRRVQYEILTLGVLDRLPEGTYTVADLATRRLAHGNRPVKILATGKLTKNISIEAHAASKSAIEAVKKAGGTLTLIK